VNRSTDEYYADYRELLASQKFVESDLDYSVVRAHADFLDQIAAIENSSISVFDLCRKNHAYLSPNFGSFLGFPIDMASREGFLEERTHPADLIDLLKAGVHFLRFAFELPRDDPRKKSFKLLTDYRIRNDRDQYVRVIEQQMGLEMDRSGNVWLALSILDISPDQDLDTPMRCRLIDTQSGDLYYFPPESESADDLPLLSPREREILALVASGFVSRQIADQLYISIHTVNTHRQRIIEKLNVSNTVEAVKYASDLGLIDTRM